MDSLEIVPACYSESCTSKDPGEPLTNGFSKTVKPLKMKIDHTNFSVNPTSENPGKLLTNFLISHPSVQFIRFQLQDLSGVLRARIVTKGYGIELATTNSPLRGPPCISNCMIDNTFMPSVDPTTMHWYFPDWPTIRARRAKGVDSLYATVMCGLVESIASNPVPRYHLCPRRALVNVLRKAEKGFGLNFLVGFEVEFVVMKIAADGQFVSYSTGLGLMAVSGLRDPSYQYVEECVLELLGSGLQLQSFHTEGRRGQYEFALGPLPPMEAIDQLLLVQDMIKSTFARHGLTATMSPKPIPLNENQSNGQHAHLSMNLLNNQDAFLAGILGRLPALCALSLPYEASYSRLKPWMGGENVAWGTENRSVPLRKIKAGHWEIRIMDATANAYLTLAAFISAGLLGIQNDEALRWKDASMPENGLTFTENGTASAIDSIQKLPTTFSDALSTLDDNFDNIEVMMGSDIIRHYVALKRHEMAQLQSLDASTLRSLFLEVF